MTLTAMYVCGTLLAFFSLSWIRAEEGVLLDDQGFGPCTATLRPEGACSLEQHGSTCPYLLSLPPLTVHLPHLKELENIMQDLQELKDTVDELRKMCVDCTESHNDRKCGRHKERENEKQTEGKSTREDVRNWMHVRLEEADRDFKLECGNDAIKVKIDRDNSTERRLILEEEERSKWETDRKGSKGAVKENEREETLTEVGEKDGKTDKDSARGKDTIDQKKMPAAGGNTRIDVTSENVFETDHRDTAKDRIKEDALKGNLKGFQEDKLESEEEKKILTNVKNKEKTKEESNIYVWQEEINKTKKTEASDKTKMSENHEDHINMEQEGHKGETRKEMETGIKVGRNNEKPKQPESAGHTEKETIKEEVEDKDRGIKEKSVQRDGDGELSQRKTTEQTDFFPISPTPLSIMRSTSRPDSSKVTILTSSLPSPSFLSSTLSSITDVSHETKGVYGLTKSSSHGTAGIFETQSHELGSTTATGTTSGGNKLEITSAAALFISASTVKPGAGLQGHKRSTTTTTTTTTTHQTLHITASPKVTDHSHWKPKKNISTNIKTILKPPPGRGLKPGQKLKSGIKPEAEQKLKNSKNDRKPNQAPDKKPKYNQKQKPAPHKPTPEKSKPGKDSKQTHISQPDQRPPPYILAPNKNQQNNLTHRQDITPKNKLPFQKPKSPQKSPTPVQKPTSQRPQTANTTHSDKHPSINKDHESAKRPVVDQNLKPDKKIVLPFKTDKPDQKQKPEKTPEREEKTKLSEMFERNQNFTPAQKQDSKRSETERFTPKPNQKHPTELVEISGENPLQEPEPKPDLMPRLKITSDKINSTSGQMNSSHQEMTETKPKSIQEPESKREADTSQPNQKPLTESVKKSETNILHGTESQPDLKSGQKFTSQHVNATSDQLNNSNQENTEIKPKPIKEPEYKRGSATSQPNQKPLTESVRKYGKNHSQKPESKPDLTLGKKFTSDPVNATSDQINNSSQATSKIKHQPNPIKELKSETATSKPDQKLLAVDKSVDNPLHGTKFIPDLTPEKKITADKVHETSDLINKSSWEITEIKHKPKPVQEPESKSETATPKPNQKHLTDTVETSDDNPIKEPEAKPDLISRKKITSDRINASPDQTPESSQEILETKHNPKLNQEPVAKKDTTTSKPNEKPLNVDKFIENPLHKPKFIPDLTPKKNISSDQVSTTSDQTNNPSQEEIIRIKQQPDLIQEPETKSETTAQPNQVLLTDSEKKSDKNPFQEPESYPDLQSGQKITFDQVNATFNQMNKTKQESPKIEQPPKSVQEPESKNQSTTSKPDQKLLTDTLETADENSLQEHEFNPDIKSGKEMTSDQVNVTSDQMNESIQGRPTIKHKPKPIQKPESKSKTASSKPNQKPSTKFADKSDKTRPHETKSNPELTPEEKITSDLVNGTSDQINKPSQEIKQKPKPIQEHESKKGETAPSKPDHKYSSESVDKSDKIPPHVTKLNPDLTPGQKMTSGQVNVTSDQKPSQKIKQRPKPIQEPGSKSETATLKPDQKALTTDKPSENPLQKYKPDQKLISGQTPASNQTPKPGQNVPTINKRPKPGPEPKRTPKYPNTQTGLKNKPNTNVKTSHMPQTNSSLKTTRPGQKPNLKPVHLYEKIPTAESNRTSKPRPPFRYRPPTRHIIKPGAKPIQMPKSPVQPMSSPKTKTLDPPQTHGVPSEKIQSSQTDMPSTSGLAKQIVEVTHTPGETSSTRTRKTITLGPKTSNSLKTGHIPRLYTHTEDFTSSPNSRIVSDLKPQTASQPPLTPMATRPNKIHRGMLQHVITSTSPESTQPSPVPKSDSIIQTNIINSVEETPPATLVLSPSLDTASTPSPDIRSETSTTSGPQPFAAELSTPSARELRVKINQVAAFVNNSLSPNGRPGDGLLKELPKERGSRPGSTNGKLPTSLTSKAPRDCSDHLLRGKTKSGVYLVTPDLRSRSFPVFCDMEREGGGWTLLQRRQDGSVSFNRTWVEYQSGFGELDGGEFWLGNNMIHLLTRDRDAVLRVELEDFEGVTGFAQYEQFRVAGERLRYRLTVGGYSGTAGDALRFSKRYDHNSRAFTTPDRDHDRYPSGNCGAYYSSGWWFDACMAANLNGKYYFGKYKGVRDGIFWGTWHNISEEYYPTNERQSFKSVRMMIRPKDFVP